jgi:hypothetical protein
MNFDEMLTRLRVDHPPAGRDLSEWHTWSEGVANELVRKGMVKLTDEPPTMEGLMRLQRASYPMQPEETLKAYERSTWRRAARIMEKRGYGYGGLDLPAVTSPDHRHEGHNGHRERYGKHANSWRNAT